MAEYKYKPSMMIDDILKGLKGLKQEAVSADKILGMIGNKGNLNKLLAVFMSMDNMVEQLRQDSDQLKASFGEQLKLGYLTNLDEEFNKLSNGIKQMQKMSEDVLNINLKNSSAPQQLQALAEQINTILEGIGSPDRINISDFITKGLKEQRDSLIGYINNIGKDITLSIGNIDSSKIGAAVGDSIADGLEDASKKVEKSGKKLESAIKKAIKNYYNAAGNAAVSGSAIAQEQLSKTKQALFKILSDELGIEGFSSKGVDKILLDLDEGNIEEDQAKEQIITMISSIKGALQNGKTELINAFKDYYDAIDNAINDRVNVFGGDISDKMQDIEDKIGDMLPNLSKEAKTELFNIFSGLTSNSINLDNIEDTVNQFILDFGVAINAPIKQAVSKVQDGSSKAGDAIQQEADKTSAAMSQAEDKTNSVTDAFEKLVNYITQSGSKPKSFFHALESGAQSVDEELKNILSTLGLIDSAGNVNFKSLSSGYTNKGGFTSDQYTMIARDIMGGYNGKVNYLQKAKDLQSKLAEAQSAGAKIGAIFDIIEDKANKLFYEIQNTVPGTAAFSKHSYTTNSDVLEATPEQLKEFVNTIKILTEKGLFIDFGGDNILYDKNNGFSIIDLGVKGGYDHTVSVQNTVQENVMRFIEEMLSNATPDQSDKIKNVLEQRLYEAANAILPSDQQIQYKTNKQATSTTADVNNIDRETAAHKENADAIEAENKAIAAQIVLKEKAQSMTWEKFAMDESLSGLKQVAGLNSLVGAEQFWQQSNYDKKIDYKEISSGEAKAIIDSKIGDLVDKWVGAVDFNAKAQIENAVLADPELRNAAMNWAYHIVQTYAKDILKGASFEEFLNTEYDMFRSDDGPTIYEAGQKLSFAFTSKAAKKVQGETVEKSQKIKPTDTIGAISTGGYADELEMFLPMSAFPKDDNSLYIQNSSKSFNEYFSNLNEKYKGQIKAQILELEQDRVKNLLGEDLTELVDNAFSESGFILKDLEIFKQGIVPEKLDIANGGWATEYTDELAIAYNNGSEMQKKLIAYYASLTDGLKTLKDKNIEPPKNHIQQMGVGQTGIINAIANNLSEFQQFADQITGVEKFNLYGATAQNISKEAQAHRENTQAIDQESAAQDKLNKKKISVSDIQSSLNEKIDNYPTMDGVHELFSLKESLYDVYDTSSSYPEEIKKGNFIRSKTGEVFDVAGLYDKVNRIESKFGIDLNNVKEYLNQVYAEYNKQIEEAFNAVNAAETAPIKFIDIDDEVYYKYTSASDPVEANKLLDLGYSLQDVNKASLYDPEAISHGQYTDSATGNLLNVKDLYDKVDEIEKAFGTDLSNVKEYLNQVYQAYNAQLDKDLETVKSNSSSISNISSSPATSNMPDFTDVEMKLSELTMIASASESDRLSELYKVLEKVNNTDQAIINDGMFYDPENLKETKVSTIVDLIQEIEDQYGENLDFVKDYINQVYKNLQTDANKIQSQEPMETIDIYLDDEDTTLTQLNKSISGAQQTLGDSSQGIENETAALTPLIEKIGQVQDAIDAKTQAFRDEAITVDDIVAQEIASLDQLDNFLSTLKNTIVSLFKNALIPDNAFETWKTDLAIIEQNVHNILDSINGITSAGNIFNGDNFSNVGGATNTSIDNGYALEVTLQATNNILNQILSAVNVDEDNSKIVSALEAAVEQLKNVSSGIIEEKKKQSADTSKASDRIADTKEYDNILAAVNGKLSSETQIGGMKALADGIVQVNGAMKNAEGAWEGFTAKVDETGKVYDIVTNKQSKLAKSLNEVAESTEKASDASEKGQKVQEQNKAKAEAETKKEEQQKNTKTKAIYGNQQVINAQAKYNSLSKQAQPYIKKGSTKVDEALLNYDTALQHLIDTQKKFSNIQDINSEEANKLKTQFKEAQNECTNYATELKNLISTSEKFQADAQNVTSIEGFDTSTIEGVRAALENYVNSMYGATAGNLKFDETTGKLSFTIKDADGKLRNMEAALDATGTVAGTTAKKVQQSTSMLDKFLSGVGSKWKELLTYFTARMGVDEIFQQIRQGIQYVRDIDSALTELKKVTDETDAAYTKFLQNMSKTASVVGSTTSELTNSAADWARLNYLGPLYGDI